MNKDPNSQYGYSTNEDPHRNMQSFLPSIPIETQYVKIDYELVRRCLIYGSADEKCEVLDAVRSRITASESSNMALNTIHEILYSDLLRLSCVCDERSLLEDLLWPKNIITPHPLQISIARLLNVLLSYKIGREYFNKKSVIQLLIWDDPERDHIEQEVADNLIAVMMKLSLNRFQCADMIKKGLLIWMVCHMAEVLMATHSTAKCHLESMTGLLRMLLSEDSAFICFDTGFIDVKNFILLLMRYLEMDNDIVKRNIYACLLAMLKKPEFVRIAKETNIAKVIKEHIESKENQSQLTENQEKTKLALKESIQGQHSNAHTLCRNIGTDTNIKVDSQNQNNGINEDARDKTVNIHLEDKKTDIYQEMNDEIVSLRLSEYEFGSNQSQNSTSTGRLASNLKLTQEGLEKLRATKLKTQLRPILIIQGQFYSDDNILKGGDTAGGNLDTQRQRLGKIDENACNSSSLPNEDLKKKSKLVEQKYMQAIFELLTRSGGPNDLPYTLDTRLDENELYLDSKIDFNNAIDVDRYPEEQLIRTKFSENQWEPNSSFIPEYNLEHDGPFLSRIYVERELPKIEGNRIFPMLHFRSMNRSERTCIRFYEKTSMSGPHHLHSPNASKIILPRWKQFQVQMSTRNTYKQTNQSHSASDGAERELGSSHGSLQENELSLETTTKVVEKESNKENCKQTSDLRPKVDPRSTEDFIQDVGIQNEHESNFSPLQGTQSLQLKESQVPQIQETQSLQGSGLPRETPNLTVEGNEKSEAYTSDSYQKSNEEANVPLDDECQDIEINDDTERLSTQPRASSPSQILGKSSPQRIESPTSQLPSLDLQENTFPMQMTDLTENNQQKYELNLINEEANVHSGNHNDIPNNDKALSPTSKLQRSPLSQIQIIQSSRLSRSQSLDAQESKLSMQTLSEKGTSERTLDLLPKVFPRSREAIVPVGIANQDDGINDATNNVQEKNEQISDLLPKISEEAHIYAENDNQITGIIDDTISSSLQKSESPASQLQGMQLAIEVKLVEEKNEKEYYDETSDIHHKINLGSPEALVHGITINEENRSQFLPLQGSQSLQLPASHLSLQVTQSLGPFEMPTEKANEPVNGNNDTVSPSSKQPVQESTSSQMQRSRLSPIPGSKSLQIHDTQTTIERANENEKIKKQASVPYFSSANSSFDRNVEAIYDGKEYDSTSPYKLEENLKKTEDGLKHLLSMIPESDTFECIGNKESLERHYMNKDKEVVVNIIEDMALGENNDNGQKSAVAIPITIQKSSEDEISSKEKLLTVDEILNNEKLVNFFCEKMISKIAARNDFCGPNCGSTCGGLNKSKIILEKRDQNADDDANSCCQVQD